MKTVHAVVAAMLVAASVNAQSLNEGSYFEKPSTNIDASRIANIYTGNLSSSNQGVIESSLAHLAMMKLMIPASDLSAAQEVVAGMASNYSSPETRYKAFLASSVISQPNMFVGMENQKYGNADEFFGEIAATMARTYATR